MNRARIILFRMCLLSFAISVFLSFLCFIFPFFSLLLHYISSFKSILFFSTTTTTGYIDTALLNGDAILARVSFANRSVYFCVNLHLIVVVCVALWVCVCVCIQTSTMPKNIVMAHNGTSFFITFFFFFFSLLLSVWQNF